MKLGEIFENTFSLTFSIGSNIRRFMDWTGIFGVTFVGFVVKIMWASFMVSLAVGLMLVDSIGWTLGAIWELMALVTGPKMATDVVFPMSEAVSLAAGIIPLELLFSQIYTLCLVLVPGAVVRVVKSFIPSISG